MFGSPHFPCDGTGRRALLQAYTAQNSSSPVYSYLFTTNTPNSNPTQGIAHGSDLNYGQFSIIFIIRLIFNVIVH